MRNMLSLLSKLLAGIAGVFSFSFFIRAFTRAAAGSAPEETTAPPDRGRRTAYSQNLPGHDEPLRPGWSRPAPEKMPEPTYWPMVFALGIAFFMWGLVSNFFVLGLGVILLVIALFGWIGDLLGEFRE